MPARRWQRPSKAIVDGDAKCRSIAAASIIAKVTRDRIMADYAREYPGYGWETNRGYPTPRTLGARSTRSADAASPPQLRAGARDRSTPCRVRYRFRNPEGESSSHTHQQIESAPALVINIL